MNLWLIIILGALQGLFEWLPISSQGNLILLMTSLFGVQTADAFSISIYLHTGTMLAAIAYYRKDIKEIFKRKNKPTLNFIITATIITGIIGGALYFFVKGLSSALGTYFIAVIGIMLVITGLVQWKKKEGYKGEPDRNDSIITGIAQGFSIIPGISRSGMTTSTLLFKGMKAGSAIKLSFLLSIPAVLIAEIGMGLIEGFALSLEALAGMGMAFITGYATIGLLTKLAKKIKFSKLCIILGAIAITGVLL